MELIFLQNLLNVNIKTMDKHIWEGWTVGDFVEDLRHQVQMIMNGASWKAPFSSKKELGEWCDENQPYYKKRIPEVVNYFAKLYSLK